MNLLTKFRWRAKAWQIALELKRAGSFEGLSDDEKVSLVISHVVTCEDIAADPKFDWAGLLAFLEAIVPLILKIIEMLS